MIILLTNTRFQESSIREVLGDNDSDTTAFITVLRDPANAFESIYSYYKLGTDVYPGMDFGQFADRLNAH